MKILNLFAGIGGNRTLWGDEHEITAIEDNREIAKIYLERFPQDIVFTTDAYKYLENTYDKFDFIWASPPCYTHSRTIFSLIKQHLKTPTIPDLKLYGMMVFLSTWFKGKWVIENVIPFYKPLIKPTVQINRHYFWANFEIPKTKINTRAFFNLSWNQLCKVHHIDPELIKSLKSTKEYRNHDIRRQVLRNILLPKIGRYILDYAMEKQINILNFVK